MSVTPTYTGATMLNEQGTKIGSIKDVVYEQDSGIAKKPKWFVVKTGLLSGQHYVPSAGSYRTEQDDVVVPYQPQQVKAAPKAGGDHVLSEHEEEELGRFYHLTDDDQA